MMSAFIKPEARLPQVFGCKVMVLLSQLLPPRLFKKGFSLMSQTTLHVVDGSEKEPNNFQEQASNHQVNFDIASTTSHKNVLEACSLAT